MPLPGPCPIVGYRLEMPETTVTDDAEPTAPVATDLADATAEDAGGRFEVRLVPRHRAAADGCVQNVRFLPHDSLHNAAVGGGSKNLCSSAVER